MRVLLVEDDVMIGRSLDRALTHAGMAVDWVRSGADCTTAIANDGYGVPPRSVSVFPTERDWTFCGRCGGRTGICR